MKTYLLTYMMTPWFVYSKFYEKLKTTYTDYRHIVDGVWIIRTEDSADDIVNTLKPLMNFNLKKGEITNDQIFCFKLSGNFDYAGYGARSTHEYIKNIKNKEE